MRDVQLTPMYDLSGESEGKQAVALSVGPMGETIVLLVAVADAPVVTGYDEQPGWASFSHSRAQRPTAATVLIHNARHVRHVPLRDLTLAHPRLQPLPDGEVLLVGARCRRFADGMAERNAHVYGPDGNLRREATFGDGIKHVQATTTGEIWVSYFDGGQWGSRIRG